MTDGSAELLRLALELEADLQSAGERALKLEGWTSREAIGDEAFIAATLLHHFYTALEAGLTRVAAVLEGGAPAGPDSHARLLRHATAELPGIRPAILAPQDWEPLREPLEFRHLYRHAYGVTLRPERLRELAQSVVRSWPGVRRRLEAFRRFVEQCAAG